MQRRRPFRVVQYRANPVRHFLTVACIAVPWKSFSRPEPNRAKCLKHFRIVTAVARSKDNRLIAPVAAVFAVAAFSNTGNNAARCVFFQLFRSRTAEQPASVFQEFFFKDLAGQHAPAEVSVFITVLFLKYMVGAGIFVKHRPPVAHINTNLQAPLRQFKQPLEPFGTAVDKNPEQILLYTAAAYFQPVGGKLFFINNDTFFGHHLCVDCGNLTGQGHQTVVFVNHNAAKSLVCTACSGGKPADAAPDNKNIGFHCLNNLTLRNRFGRSFPGVATFWRPVAVKLHFQLLYHPYSPSFYRRKIIHLTRRGPRTKHTSNAITIAPQK